MGGFFKNLGRAFKNQGRAMKDGDWTGVVWPSTGTGSGSSGTGSGGGTDDEWKLVHEKFREVMGREPYSFQELKDWWNR